MGRADPQDTKRSIPRHASICGGCRVGTGVAIQAGARSRSPEAQPGRPFEGDPVRELGDVLADGRTHVSRKRRQRAEVDRHETRADGLVELRSAERTRERAYEIYKERTALGTPGDAESDWLRAETELSADRAGERATSG